MTSKLRRVSNKIPYRVNNEIRAVSVRVIDAEGRQVGVMSGAEALQKARELELDLIEIAPRAVPPVAKIVNLGKFLYQEEKRKKSEQKKGKSGELKEIRLSPFIAENDYQTRFKRIKEFLEGKNKVKVVVVFKGRQLGSKQFGYQLIRRVVSDLGGGVATDMEPKFIGRHLVSVISPMVKKNAKIPARNASQSDAGGKNE